jgi:DNA-binding winged helix-turn-helix (wHTH) protein
MPNADDTPAPPVARTLPSRAALARVWRFGSVVLDERSLELTVSGRVVALERKPLEVLTYLLQRAGNLVTKEELAQALWPGRIVTDSNLTKCIAVIRTALQDRTHEIIKTVHGYGYRVIAPVFVEREGVSEEPWLGAAGHLTNIHAANVAIQPEPS